MKAILIIFLVFVLTPTQAQKVQQTQQVKPIDASAVFAETIVPERLKRHLMIIASDAMEGRETGQSGLIKAAKYIEGRLANYHIEPFGQRDTSGKAQYQQPFAYHKEKWSEKTIKIGEHFLKDKDYYADIKTNANLPLLNVNKILFLGYGIEDSPYNDYAGNDVKGKTIIIFEGEPKRKNGQYVVSKTDSPSKWSTNESLKYEAAFRHGAALVFVIKKDLVSIRPRISSSWQMGAGLNPKAKFANNIQITEGAAQLILGRKYKKLQKYRRKIQKKGKPKSFVAKTKMKVELSVNRKALKGANILAVIEGSDPILKDQYVFISAHYDHLGTRGDDIYNGADDNGSGSSTLLELANAFAQAKKAKMGPKRSVVFMWMAGEEKGLLGSAYYVEYPLVPLKNTVADINIDMIGRVDETHKGHPEYVYVIGADRLSTDLDKIVKEANGQVQLDLDYRYNEDSDPNRFYYRSDHYNFAKNNIPSVFFFNGTHADYHRPSDTVDKINFDKMSKIAKLTFYTAWEIANRAERLKVDVTGRN